MNRVYLPSPVLGELLFGAVNSAYERQNRTRIAALRGRSHVLDVDEQTAERYAAIRFALKGIGRPIPENDLWIAAICVRHAVPLATFDAHFSIVAGLSVVRP